MNEAHWMLPTSNYQRGVQMPAVMFADFLTSNAIRPGQKAPFQWGLHARGGKLQGNSVIATVYLDDGSNTRLWTSPITNLTGPSNQLTTGMQTGTIAVEPPGGTAYTLYGVGQVPLRIDVAPPHAADFVYCSSYDNLAVLPDDVNGTWWEWTQASGDRDPDSPNQGPQQGGIDYAYYDFIINHPFTLAGRLVNHCAGATTISGSLVLLETNSDRVTTEIESRPFSIAPGASEDFVFTPIKKNWTWLIPGVWADVPPGFYHGTEDYRYSVRFKVSDSYGNNYQDTTSAIVNIGIDITQAKQALADGAVAAKAVGTIASVFTFGVAAAAGEAVAAGLGAKALDPPEPDRQYEELFQVADSLITRSDFEVAGCAELADVLILSDRVVAQLDAIGMTENRLLGASIADNQKAVARQRRYYQQLADLLEATAAELVNAVPAAVKWATSQHDLSRDSIQRTLLHWQRGGIPSANRQELLAGGCSIETIESLFNGICDPSLSNLAQDLPGALRDLGAAMWRIARSNRSATEAVVQKVRRPRGRSRSATA